MNRLSATSDKSHNKQEDKLQHITQRNTTWRKDTESVQQKYEVITTCPRITDICLAKAALSKPLSVCTIHTTIIQLHTP